MNRITRPAMRDGLIVVLAFASVFAYVIGAGGIGEVGFPLDDAWIHQTYARNLAESGQWAFVPGEPSAGSTAPLYTLLLAVGYALGLPYLWWAAFWGALALAAAGLVAARLAQRLLPDYALVDWGAGLGVTLSWHMIWAGASGMETMLFTALTLALVALAWRELDAVQDTHTAALGRGAVFGVVGAAATLTRPEAIGLVGLAGLLVWIALFSKDWRRIAAWSLGVGIGVGIGVVPYVLLNLQLGGQILPNTASAKQAENAPLLAISYPGRVINLLFPLIAGGQLMVLPGIVAFVLDAGRRVFRFRRVALHLLPVVWAAALVAVYAARLPAPYQHGRYVMPTLPFWIIAGVVGTALLLRWGKGSLAGRVATRTLAVGAALLFAQFWSVGLQQYGVDVQIIQSEMVDVSHWIAENIPPEDLLAVHDIGAVGYFAPRPLLDLAGLVSPEVIPIIRDPNALWAMMAARDAVYLMALPDQIPGGDVNDPRLCEVYSSGGQWSPQAGGANMAVYALAWDGVCPDGVD